MICTFITRMIGVNILHFSYFASATEAIITLPIIEPGTTGEELINNGSAYLVSGFYAIISGSCVDSGLVGCCEDGGCRITAENTSCYCDATCYKEEDCCYDISLLNCTETISKLVQCKLHMFVCIDNTGVCLCL